MIKTNSTSISIVITWDDIRDLESNVPYEVKTKIVKSDDDNINFSNTELVKLDEIDDCTDEI